MSKMSDDELISLIEMEESNCISSSTGVLAEQRRKAMQYYYGLPYGNEDEGRSQVVTTEVKEAVEGILPSLMEIFTASDEIVRFEPQNQDDDAVAQQATDYANYVFTRINNGFLALYCLFKDALLQKNGYVKVYWEDYEDQNKESYEDLTDDEFHVLLQDEELELVEHTSKPIDDPMAMQAAKMMGMPVPQDHDAVFRRTKKYGKICIDPVPPEEVLISRETPNDLSKARFVEHRTLKTISQIRQMGYEIADDIADFAVNADFNPERIERNISDDAYGFRLTDGTNDPSTRQVWLCEVYMFVDFDKDGIAEYRKITKVGHTLLDNEEFDSLPIIGGTAVLMPHKHYGLSVFDLIGDIQLIKSTVTRQLLDNAYVANNGRMAVLDGMVNMGDLLTSRPNGIVRTKAMGAIQRIDQPVLGAPFYGLLEYFDKVAQTRVGSTGFPNAVDPDAINAKATFVDKFAEAAMERINLMARILAEGPVKAIFWKIIELESKHRQKPVVAKLRGTWQNVDPREWRNKFDMTVTVGIGTGSQQKVLNGAMGILNIQQGMGAAGLAGRVVSEQNAYHAGRCYAKAVFPKDADLFFTDPTTLAPRQQPPNPELLKLQAQDHWKQMADAQKRDKMAQDERMAEMERAFQAQTEQFAAQVEQLSLEKKNAAQLQLKLMEKDQAAREKVVDLMRELKVQQDQQNHEKDSQVIGGLIESMLEQQKAANEHMARVHEAMLAPKEIVRDAKGKATGVRPTK